MKTPFVRFYPDRPLRGGKAVTKVPRQPRKLKHAERYARVLELADGTQTVEEIAAEIGTTTKEVHAAFVHLRGVGQTPRFKESVFASKNLTKYRNAEILRMLDDGFTQTEVADHFGISQNRVSQIKLRARKTLNKRPIIS